MTYAFDDFMSWMMTAICVVDWFWFWAFCKLVNPARISFAMCFVLKSENMVS